ncbi:MAG TPA: hypothetical protein VGD19_11470 [Allosphingosinicella sp.]|jgi:hypothetical protein
MASQRIAVAAAVNDRSVLGQCLAASPDIRSEALKLRTYEGYPSASIAYNRALDECDAEILIFAHQDVYLPRGFMANLDDKLRELDRVAPDWAVAGVTGANAQRVMYGRIWSSGLGQLIGGDNSLPAQVDTLDEMLIIVRLEAGLRFDDRLPGFHLYAADIIEIARSAGRTSWVIDAPAVHHSRPVLNLGGSYTHAWHYMRRKWWDRLPIMNLVCPLTRSKLTLWKTDFGLRLIHRGRAERMQPKSDPAAIAAELGFDR